jgi:RHS repeat-associated protein
VDADHDFVPEYFVPDVLMSTDYDPYGTELPGRVYNSPMYRYGFNGKEKDDDFNGTGNMYDYGFRVYDPRIGRFLSVDPLAPEYQFAGNKVISCVDLDGMEEKQSYKIPMPSQYVNAGLEKCKIGSYSLVTGGANYINAQADFVFGAVTGAGLVNHCVDQIEMSNRIWSGEASWQDYAGVGSHTAGVNMQYSQCMQTMGTIQHVADGDIDAICYDVGSYTAQAAAIVAPELLCGKMGAASRIESVPARTRTAAEQLAINQEAGTVAENIVRTQLEAEGHTNIASQVSIRPTGANYNIRIDFISTVEEQICLTEVKASESAPFTRNQTVGIPVVGELGGQIRGNSGVDFGYRNGMTLPPTRVNVIRGPFPSPASSIPQTTSYTNFILQGSVILSQPPQ